MNRSIAIGLLTAILCVQGALLWHFVTMDTSVHATCPISLIARSGCVDMSNVVDTTVHHISTFADIVTAIPISSLVMLALLFCVAVFVAVFARPPSSALLRSSRAKQSRARFYAARKRQNWLAALRIQGIDLMHSVAA